MNQATLYVNPRVRALFFIRFNRLMRKSGYDRQSTPEWDKLYLIDQYYALYTKGEAGEVIIEHAGFGITNGFQIYGNRNQLESLYTSLTEDLFGF